MCESRCVVSLLLFVCTNLGAQTINEIHPTPSAGEPEWIEIYNATNRTINISRWMVCDNRSCCELPENSYVPAHAYAVLTRDSAALREARPLPDACILIEARLPSLNNTVDDVILRNSDSTRIDSLSYTMAWGRKGLSLERVAADGVDIWSASLSSDSATCGYLNSVVQLSHDLRVADIRAGRGSIDVVVVNHGRNAAAPRRCVVALDDFVQESVTAEIPALGVGDMYVWSIDIELIRSLHPDIEMKMQAALLPGDDRVENDVVTTLLVLPPIVNTVTITEVMYDPFETQADYVEICNTGPDTIDLDGWYILDGEDASVEGETDNRARALIDASLLLGPGEYGVVLMDTMHASMIMSSDKPRSYICMHGINANALGDALTLCTSSGFLVDSISYTPDMHEAALASTKGVALEKREPRLSGLGASAWTSSGNLKGGTPARANSVQIDIPVTTSIDASPNPFSSSRADTRYPCAIAFKQPFMHAIVGLRILTPSGIHVRWLLNATFVGSEGVVLWDGADDMGRRVVPGQYVAALEAADASSTHMHHDAAVIVVGE